MNIFDSWIVKTPIAHRGLHDKNTPELSLAAFEKAINAGFAIEIDVRSLKDGTIVCFHDETLGRMTGHDGFIVNCNFSDIAELKLLKSDEHIPTLKEALKFINGRVPVLIDIKNMQKIDFEKNIWKELKGYKGEYAVQSFNPYTLEWFKLNAPQVKRGQISSYFKGDNTLPFLQRLALRRMSFNKKVSEPNFINYALENLPNRYVNKCKKQGLPVVCYCVKDEESLQRAKKYADNFVFDNIEIK